MLNNLRNTIKYLKIFVPVVSIAFATSACNFSFNVSTATLEEAKMCVKVEEHHTCSSDTTKFEKSTPKIFVTSDLKYAPTGTKVKIQWKYLGGEAGKEADIDTITLETKPDTNFIISSLTAPDNGFPQGNYEVTISLDTDNSKPVSKKFSISKSQ